MVCKCLFYTNINILGFLFLFLFVSCNQNKKVAFEEINRKIKQKNNRYEEFCKNLKLPGDFENKAVLSSFFGEYNRSIYLASKSKDVEGRKDIHIEIESGLNTDSILNSLNYIVSDETESEYSKSYTRKLLNLIKPSSSTTEVFENSKRIDAVNFITQKAMKYQFTLINEAHYSSQNRNFTAQLLKPLWEQGYRYLALEALSHGDSNINNRGYPEYSSGYYLQDSNFGNLVRKALSIGYEIVPYESQTGNDGSERDLDQALNLLNRINTEEKVIVHAGYSHISEFGGENYKPLGYQLKKITKHDVFTIDQVEMVSYPETQKANKYYRYLDSLSKITTPIVVLDSLGEMIVDPISKNSIDVQVYHPETKFKNGRPNWLKNTSNDYINLPEKITDNYLDHLITVRNQNESKDAVPIDQFIIGEDRHLVLPDGNYIIGIFNCDGDLVKEFNLYNN